jgi:hypothetical protein
MKTIARYTWQVLRHKWFVFVECWHAGIPVRGILHDLSKFLPSEFFAYAAYFYGPEARKDSAAFDLAWLRHQKRNPHHWQWWLLPLDDGGTNALPMSQGARLEMLCDWTGAGRAYGGNGTLAWYAKNCDRMVLNADTRAWVEAELSKRGH